MIKYIIKKIVYIYYRIFFRVEIEGRENFDNIKACIISPNHISNHDAPLIVSSLAKLPIYSMGKKELFSFKPFGWFLTKMGVYPVDRSKNDMGAVKKSLSYLKKDNYLCIFPEGTRNGVAKGEKLHNGVAFLAIATKVPVIPVGISSNYKLFGKIYLKIGKPIYFEEYYGLDNVKSKYDEINQKLYNEIRNLLV